MLLFTAKFLRKLSYFCLISGSHNAGYEELYFLGYDTVYLCGRQPTLEHIACIFSVKE
jgi:hypothetical protein